MSRKMKPLSTTKKSEQNKKIAGITAHNDDYSEIGKILNQGYQREYLVDIISRNAMEFQQ